jgi:hypothetical protein
MIEKYYAKTSDIADELDQLISDLLPPKAGTYGEPVPSNRRRRCRHPAKESLS